MSESHTDKIDSQASEELRRSMLGSMSGADDAGSLPEFEWLGDASSSPSTQDANTFRKSERTTVPKQVINDMAAQKITAYLPAGNYRLRTGSTTCNAVTRSELARLICVGAISGEAELMHEGGDWESYANHPALTNVRNMFGSDLAAILA